MGWNGRFKLQREASSKARVLALVGPGRAGVTVAAALRHHGWRVSGVAGRSPGAGSTHSAAEFLDAPVADISDVAIGADFVLVATPDTAIASAAVAASQSVRPDAFVFHLAGSLGIVAFDGLHTARPDVRLGAVHPLRSLQWPTSPAAAAASLEGTWCATSGDSSSTEVARALGMRCFSLTDSQRVAYHSTAVVASNHLVALAGQVERLADASGVPFEAFVELMRTSLENVAGLGPAHALTGPVARGDLATVEAHLAAIPAAERPTYRALAREALKLVEMESPALAALLDEPSEPTRERTGDPAVAEVCS